MANSGFQFKQFFIEHSQVAMKVGTDSIILGSWLNVGHAQRILDIGTGSGLLAIMLAQKSTNHTRITGIDIDENAIEQSRLNAATCPWPEKLNFIHQPVQHYSDGRFDLIVSNPPYYPSGQSFEHYRQQARHTQQLHHQQLLQHSQRLLNPDGFFACIIPAQFAGLIKQYAQECGLLPLQQLNVKTVPDKAVSRVAILFSRIRHHFLQQELVIHRATGEYSNAYVTLCKDYYLNF